MLNEFFYREQIMYMYLPEQGMLLRKLRHKRLALVRVFLGNEAELI